MKKKSILLPLTLLAVALYAILSGGQFDIWKDQEKWYTLVLLFGLAFFYIKERRSKKALMCLSVCL
ncbi:hypothetical protein BsIDN1_48890 [Bacillus safensis]|uniref:Uncharacterized protein n=1 Tax=Bacillus safensis TaxID=561879 RepID=A0A5S9MEA4_BACIA|nr:hypothetical protein BsIDN1_48890 [Bacillus safensis]